MSLPITVKNVKKFDRDIQNHFIEIEFPGKI